MTISFAEEANLFRTMKIVMVYYLSDNTSDNYLTIRVEKKK